MTVAELNKTNPQSSQNDAGVDLNWLAQRVEYGLYQDCVHCGLCTASCPTYVMTGDENDSPRGRIYLMRAVVDGRANASEKVREHLGLCLDCRACESACPSGVQYGKLIEPFKVALELSIRKPHETRSHACQSRTGTWHLEILGLHRFNPDHAQNLATNASDATP